MINIKQLYKFRSVFLPKEGGGYRPIAISETILLVFHKIIMHKLRKQTKLSDH